MTTKYYESLTSKDDNTVVAELLALPEHLLDRLAKCVFMAQEEHKFVDEQTYKLGEVDV